MVFLTTFTVRLSTGVKHAVRSTERWRRRFVMLEMTGVEDVVGRIIVVHVPRPLRGKNQKERASRSGLF